MGGRAYLIPSFPLFYLKADIVHAVHPEWDSSPDNDKE